MRKEKYQKKYLTSYDEIVKADYYYANQKDDDFGKEFDVLIETFFRRTKKGIIHYRREILNDTAIGSNGMLLPNGELHLVCISPIKVKKRPSIIHYNNILLGKDEFTYFKRNVIYIGNPNCQTKDLTYLNPRCWDLSSGTYFGKNILTDRVFNSSLNLMPVSEMIKRYGVEEDRT